MGFHLRDPCRQTVRLTNRRRPAFVVPARTPASSAPATAVATSCSQWGRPSRDLWHALIHPRGRGPVASQTPTRTGLVPQADRRIRAAICNSSSASCSFGVGEVEALARPVVEFVGDKASNSCSVTVAKSKPLGKYCRSRPLVFSLEPRCQGCVRVAEEHVDAGVDADLLPVAHFRSLVPGQRAPERLGQRLDPVRSWIGKGETAGQAQPGTLATPSPRARPTTTTPPSPAGKPPSLASPQPPASITAIHNNAMTANRTVTAARARGCE